MTTLSFFHQGDCDHEYTVLRVVLSNKLPLVLPWIYLRIMHYVCTNLSFLPKPFKVILRIQMPSGIFILRCISFQCSSSDKLLHQTLDTHSVLLIKVLYVLNYWHFNHPDTLSIAWKQKATRLALFYDFRWLTGHVTVHVDQENFKSFACSFIMMVNSLMSSLYRANT